MKYYYITSGKHYLNGKENTFYKNKLYLGTFTNNYLEAEKIKFHHTNQKEVILKDLQQQYDNITANTKEDKEKRIKLQKRIELGKQDLKLYYNAEITEIPIDEIVEAQNLLKLNTIFMGDVYSFFLNDLKDNLQGLTRLSKNDIKIIKSSQKALKGNEKDFAKLLGVDEDKTFDFQEEYIKMVMNIANVGFHEPKFLNEWFEMMQEKKGLEIMKETLKNWKDGV